MTTRIHIAIQRAAAVCWPIVLLAMVIVTPLLVKKSMDSHK
jgi:hypothetical protein